MKKPYDTRGTDPLLIIAAAMSGEDPTQFILDQEAQGQQDMVASESLPTDGIENVRVIIEENGGKILDPFQDDPMFTEVVLPEGWSKRPTDHAMWSDLVDANGNVRATIFYKAAFYDRRATIYAKRRFGIVDYPLREDGKRYAKIDDAMGKVEFMSNLYNKEDFAEPWKADDMANMEVALFLNENYPDWENPNAYWVD